MSAPGCLMNGTDSNTLNPNGPPIGVVQLLGRESPQTEGVHGRFIFVLDPIPVGPMSILWEAVDHSSFLLLLTFVFSDSVSALRFRTPVASSLMTCSIDFETDVMSL